MASHKVVIVVPRSFTPFLLGVALEIFGADHGQSNWYGVQLCTSRPGLLTARGGVFSMRVSRDVRLLETADTVVIPGTDELMCAGDAPLPSALRAAHDRGARLVSFCTGAFALAAAGVVDGSLVTTHWRWAATLAKSYPNVRVVPHELFVDAGGVLTSAGSSAAIDLGLYLIGQDYGSRMAGQVARDLVVALRRDGDQAQFTPPLLEEQPCTHPRIKRAMDFVDRHVDQRTDTETLASVAAMSPRNFHRRFREATGFTPNQWTVARRLAHARTLLEETSYSVSKVAQLTGFASTSTLRQRFAQHVGTSPSAYRRAFRASHTTGPASHHRFA